MCSSTWLIGIPKRKNKKNGSREVIKNDDDGDDSNIRKLPQNDGHKLPYGKIVTWVTPCIT